MTKKQSPKKPPGYSQALRQLAQNARVGCVAFAVERALADYPATLKTKFHLDDALAAAWSFVATGACDADNDDRIADAISDELGQLEQDGYTYDHGLMGISLVLGCRQPASLLAAVENAGRVWALGPGATLEEKESDPDGLRGPVYARLQEAIAACNSSKRPGRWESVIRASGEPAPGEEKPTRTTKEPVTKKAVTKKAVTKKPVAKKAVTKKAVTKKAVTKKAVTKKPVTKKPVTKKPGPKKTRSPKR